MTRGKIQFVEKNWQVYSTLEFNGDMYPSGHGHEIIMHFKKGGFRTRDDYEAYAVDFDERNFGYCNAGYGLISSLGTYEGKPDFVFNEHYTDYLYIVNASGKNITLLSRKDREAPGTEVILPPDQMAIVCFYTVEDIVEREAADLQILPISEKEYNGFLFDQLSLLEDIENVAKKDGAVETLEMIERKRQQIERKLGQEMLVS